MGVVRMVSDEELIEWGKKHYPEYANNVKLMRILYEREMRGKKESRSGVMYVRKKVKDMSEGEFVEAELLVADYIRTSRYVGCKKCRRKNCACGVGKVTYRRDSYVCGDETGVIVVHLPWKEDRDYEYLEIGSKILVRGRVEKYKDRLDIQAREYKCIDYKKDSEKEKRIAEIIEKLKPTKEMSRDVFERFIERKYGLTFDDVKKYVKVVKIDGEEWVVFE